MTIILIILNIALLAAVVILLINNRKLSVKSGKMFSDLEDIDLIEFQQNLKALIEELNKVAGTSIKNMEDKKVETEFAVKTADLRINEIKYLVERNQLQRQAEYKEVINEPVIKYEKSVVSDTTEEANDDKDKTSKVIFTGMEEPDDTQTPSVKADLKIPAQDKYQHINALIKNGLSIQEIAKVTGLTRGEIELVRNIKK
jgi:hypothetical protein